MSSLPERTIKMSPDALRAEIEHLLEAGPRNEEDAANSLMGLVGESRRAAKVLLGMLREARTPMGGDLMPAVQVAEIARRLAHARTLIEDPEWPRVDELWEGMSALADLADELFKRMLEQQDRWCRQRGMLR